MIWKSVIRVAVLSGLGIGVLYLMTHYGLLDVDSIFHAFQKGYWWVALIILSQIALAFLMMVRYFYVLRSVGIEATFSQVISASFVSNGLGQWAPGSIAITEMIRVGLILGSEARTDSKLRVAMASIIDRLVGFFVILTLGGITSLSLFGHQFQILEKIGPAQWSLLALGVVSLGGGFALGLFPFVSQWKLFHLLFDRFERVSHFQREISDCLSEPRKLVLPVLLSFLCFFTSCWGLYAASVASGAAVPLLATFATFPVIAVSGLLPLGFGGLGGYQLVAVGVFGILGIPSSAVSSASLLQNAMALVVNTLLGFGQLHNCKDQVQRILAKVGRKEERKA